MNRSRRQVQSKRKGAIQAALKNLGKVRDGETKRSEQYVAEETVVYDEVNEDEYQEIVKERRKRDNFVVDDGILSF